MYKKLIYLTSFILLLSLVLPSIGNDADPDLVGWWKLDDGAGNIAADSSGNGNDGTLYGGTMWVYGVYGAALQFNGSDSYVSTGKSLLNGLTEFTLSGWISVANPGTMGSRIALFGQNDTIEFGFANGEVGGYTPTASVVGDPWQWIGIPYTFPYPSWHHVALVGVPTEVAFYFDGEEVASADVVTADYGTSSYLFNIGAAVLDSSGNWFEGEIDDVRLYYGALEDIQTTMTGTEVYTAFGPYPIVGAIDVPLDVVCSWTPAKHAVTHDLYFGTDANDVNEATINDPRGVLISQNIAESTFNPPSNLDYDKTYYWRVDEVNEANPDSPWKGKLWSFTTANFIVVDEFEDYNDFSPNEIWNTWIDGYGDPTNGATAGYPAPAFFAGEHYMEDDVVHGGDWSMPLFYDNTEAGLSEVTRIFNDDWTRDDVLTLTLWYYGDASNVAEPMYVALNGNAVVTNDNPKAALDNEWNQWDILLQDFADLGVNLANVNTMSIGFGNKADPQPGGGEGHVFFDDIRLYRSLPKEVEPEPEPVDPGTANLVAYYAFENDAQDGSGNGYNATLSGNPQFVEGPTGYGMAIGLDGTGDYVTLPIGSAIASMNDITVTTWANFSNVGGAWQRLWDFGTGEQVYMFLSPRISSDGPMRFAITTSGGGGESQVSAPATLPTGWRHVAASIDSVSMTMKLYQDGKLVAEGETSVLPSDLGQTTQNWLGRSQFVADAYYLGSLDEFRIYNRALSHGEIRYLAGK